MYINAMYHQFSPRHQTSMAWFCWHCSCTCTTINDHHVCATSRGCLCIGCNTTATQAIRMAYFHTSRLYASLEKKRTRSPEALKLVGARLARVLHAHICLLLDTQARQTATRSLLSQSQLCLQASPILPFPCTALNCLCTFHTGFCVCTHTVCMHMVDGLSVCTWRMHEAEFTWQMHEANA